MRRKTEKQETRADGLVNVISGLGIAGRDKTVSNRFQFAPLSPAELEEVYRGGGIGKRIVNLPIHEMTREWFDVEGDPGGAVLGYLETLKAKQAIQEAMRWGDLYGGAILVLTFDDREGNLSQPVNLAALNGIASLHVYDRHQVAWTTADLYADKRHAKFNQPERYRVTPYSGGEGFVVHETRTLRFLGEPVPPRAARENQGWADSVLQAPYASVRNMVAAFAHSANLIEEWAVGVVTIKNLVQLLAAKGGEAKVRQRLEIMDFGKGVLRSLILAEGETFDKKVASISGLPELIDRLWQAVSADTGIPVSLLAGEPPSGLQATGQYNQANWYDEIKARQEAKLQSQLETLVRYVFLSRGGPTRGKEPPNWKIAFRPLWQMDPKEKADLRQTIGETDVAYVNAGVLKPHEVATSRFGDRWSAETKIDKALHTEEADLANDPAKANGKDKGAAAGAA